MIKIFATQVQHLVIECESKIDAGVRMGKKLNHFILF